MASKSKIFFDANVLLEIQLQRQNHAEATKIIRQNITNMRCLSALSGHLLQHFRPKELAIDDVRSFLGLFEMYGLLAEDFEWAYDNRRDDDFEDALQLAVAVRNGCTDFYTFDRKLVKKYEDLPTLEVHLLE